MLLEQMYLDHGPVVWRIVYAWTGGDRDTADDAVAEAFARAGRRLDAIRDPRRWLIVTALNAAKAELGRRAVVVASGEAAGFADAAVGGSGGLLGLEMAQLIARLPLAQRTAVVLCDVFGYPVADIAAMAGPRVAVRVHLHRARARLRDMLRDGE
jgi:RNA polymerase sigma-70 factor, ECF subfamily